MLRMSQRRFPRGKGVVKTVGRKEKTKKERSKKGGERGK
jgi:hypothetical protein